MYQYIIVAAIFLFFVISAVAVFAIISLSISKYNSFVEKNSIRLQKLTELNKKYTFYKNIKLMIEHSYDNEKMFTDLNPEDYLIYELNTQFKSEVLRDINFVDYNKNNYDKYINEVNNLNKYEYSEDTSKYNIKKLNEYEDRMFNRLLINPITKYELKVLLHKTDINGRILHNKYSIFNPDQINSFIKRLNNKSGYYYNDKGIWNSLCKVERAKVSNKIRFAVFARDGNRCKYCGSTRDLEVDHIKPIAKGGKTYMNNLQTLCHNCNVKKGDKW